MDTRHSFTIINDMGKDEVGAGTGRTREMFILFWQHLLMV